MNTVLRLAEWLKKALFLALVVLCILAIVWGMLYKLFLPFTPMWLDQITIVAVPLALLIAWLIGRHTKEPNAGDKLSVEPSVAVPDAAAQLASEEQSTS